MLGEEIAGCLTGACARIDEIERGRSMPGLRNGRTPWASVNVWVFVFVFFRFLCCEISEKNTVCKSDPRVLGLEQYHGEKNISDAKGTSASLKSFICFSQTRWKRLQTHSHGSNP